MIILSVHPDAITNQFTASDLLAACSAAPFTIAAVQEASLDAETAAATGCSSCRLLCASSSSSGPRARVLS